MARILGVPESKAGFFARFAYSIARKRLGKVPEPMTVIAHHPKVFQAYGGYEYFSEKAHLVDAKLKCLAELKTATLIGCPF